jgi:hypothetical protein
MSGKRQLILGIAIGFVMLILPSLLLLPQSLIRTAEYRIGARLPVWSWRNGTTLMQDAAADVLVTHIKPGMSYQEVLGIIGPGSKEWLNDSFHIRDEGFRIMVHKLRPEGGLGFDVIHSESFNIRDDGNDGIDVDFQDGRVVRAHRYN